MACSVLKHCGKQGSGSKVSVEQVQVTFGKFPRTNALSVKFSYDFFFFAIFGRVYFFFGYPPAEIVGSCLGAKLYEIIMIIQTHLVLTVWLSPLHINFFDHPSSSAT